MQRRLAEQLPSLIGVLRDKLAACQVERTGQKDWSNALVKNTGQKHGSKTDQKHQSTHGSKSLVEIAGRRRGRLSLPRGCDRRTWFLTTGLDQF